MQLADLQLDVSQSVEINAPATKVFTAMLKRLGEEQSTPDGTPMPMVLEDWPGGRWYRDLGGNQGHLWGFVQVIKPPRLLEIQGPMFMSYPAAGHLQLKLTESEQGTTVSLRHRVLGLIEDDHRSGIVPGWQHLLECVRLSAEASRVPQK